MAAERGAVRPPGGMTVRFLLLVAAVLATGTIVFTFAYAHVPGKVEHLLRSGETCTAQRNAALADLGEIDTYDKQDEEQRIWRVWQRCVLPGYLDQAAFVGYGLLALFGVAVVSYLVHPWLLRRRRRLRRLSADDMPELVAYLDGLSRDVGLARPPRWRWAPYARTAGGQAFGLPGRRCVQLDAPLLVQYTVDRPAFRAVVLHELAHLRNRDVDTTYLTIGIWRGFVAVALVPMLALIVHPLLLRAPSLWHWRGIALISDPSDTAYRLASLLLLAVLVYICRNAILRVRETHADAVAAEHDGPASALPDVLARLRPAPGPTWLRRWSAHPQPQARRAAVADPLLLRGGLWELAEVGVLAGLVGNNIGFLLASYFVLDPFTGKALVGLFTGPLMTAMLALVIWRRVTADPAGQRTARAWLLPAAALVGGYVAGSALSLNSVNDAIIGRYAAGPVTLLVSALILLAGLSVTAIWLLSTTRELVCRPAPPRWAMAAVVATAVVFAAGWVPVWYANADVDQSWAVQFGRIPDPGGDIGWYRTLTTWVFSDIGALYRLYHQPLLPIAVTLLWLVPVAAGLRERPLRLGVRAGLAGALAVVVAGVALPFVTRAVLPADARRPAEQIVPDTTPFETVYFFTFIAVAVLVQCVVAAAVVARATGRRPAATVLAVSITATVATAVVFWVFNPVSCRINILDQLPAPSHCLSMPDRTSLSMIASWLAVRGLLAAVLVAAVTALVVALVRRLRGKGHTTGAAVLEPARTGRVATVVWVGVLVLVAAATTTTTIAGLPYAREVWLSWLLS